MGVLARLGWEVWVDIQATTGRVMRLTKRGIDLRCSTAELVTIRRRAEGSYCGVVVA